MNKLLVRLRNAFWPTDRDLRVRRLELTLWGVLFALAFYPWGTGFLAWFALIRPFHIASRLSPSAAFKAGYYFSFIFNLVALYWIGFVSPPGMITAVAILSLYSAAIFGLFSAVFSRRPRLAIILLPFLWVGMEYFRSLGQFSFPWTDIVYSQADCGYMIQSAALGGAHLVSLCVLTFTALGVAALNTSFRAERRLVCGTLALVVAALNLAYGWIVMPRIPEPGSVKVGLLQGDFAIENKWSPEMKERNFFVYDSLGGLAGNDSAELIVWPETAAPSYLYFDKEFTLSHTQRARKNAPNLIGGMHADMSHTPMRYYNAAAQVGSDGSFSAPYLKTKLVPFAEQVPYQEYMPFLRREFLEKYLTFIKTYDVEWWSDFFPGDSLMILRFSSRAQDTMRYAPLICFEVAYPDYVRECVRRGADFLVTITNDTWFKKSPGPFQHAWIVRVRAVENRIWIARAANSGFTFVVDPYGVVREKLPWYQTGYVVGAVNPVSDFSLYVRFGPLAGIASLFCLTVTIIAVGVLATAHRLATKNK